MATKAKPTAANKTKARPAAKAAPLPSPRVAEEETAQAATGRKYRTMREFWPFYLHEHSRRGTRALHLAGTAIALASIVLAIVLLQPWFLLGALVAGYAFAWVAHFFVEHNRPATFTYPFKSFASDWVMFGAFLTGRLGKQLAKHGVRPKA